MGAREKLIERCDIARIETVDCSDIFGDPEDIFYLRYLNMRTWEEYQLPALAVIKGDRKHSGMRAMLLAMSLCDEEGTLLFNYKQKADVELCDRIHIRIAERLNTRAQEINTGTKEKLEEEVKNSNGAATDDSFSS